MYSVEKRFEQWRAALSASETLTAADINELESHLRDEIRHLQGTGLSEVEAFLVARHRIGDTALLEQEFAKINMRSRLETRFRWIAAGAVLYLLMAHLGSSVSSVFMWLGFEHGLRNVAGLAAFGGFVRIVTVVAALFFAPWLYTRLWQQTASRSVSRVTIVFSEVALVLAIFVLYAIQMLSRAVMVSTLSVRDFGSISLAGAYDEMVWRVLIPILLMGWLAARHLRKSPKASPM